MAEVYVRSIKKSMHFLIIRPIWYESDTSKVGLILVLYHDLVLN